MTFEDGGELISFTTWAWWGRGIRIVDAFIILYETQLGDTALMKASAEGHFEVVKLLLSAQASVNQTDLVRNYIHASCVLDLTLSMLAFF